VCWILGTAIIVAQFAIGSTLNAVITLVGTIALVVWARNRSKRTE
jgi:hypothetical protein